jgi:hypothetical protein
MDCGGNAAAEACISVEWSSRFIAGVSSREQAFSGSRLRDACAERGNGRTAFSHAPRASARYPERTNPVERQSGGSNAGVDAGDPAGGMSIRAVVARVRRAGATSQPAANPAP